MLLQKFLEYLESEKNYSPHTIMAYQKDIEDLQYFLNPIELQYASKKNIKNFLAHLLQSNQHERSINRKLSAVKTFYQFLLLTDTINQSPTIGIKSLKYYNKAQIPFTTQEMNNLLDSDIFDDSYIHQRNKLIIELLYHTGMRKSELINLTYQNIDLTKKQIKILGKNNKERIIPINQKLIDAIYKYVSICKKHNISIENYLFLTKNQKRMYPKLVYEIVNTYLSFVTEKSKKSPHMLRHSLATHLLQSGAEINAVKEILGHSSLAATQVYTHNDIAHLKKVFNKTHPRESK